MISESLQSLHLQQRQKTFLLYYLQLEGLRLNLKVDQFKGLVICLAKKIIHPQISVFGACPVLKPVVSLIGAA